MLNGRSINAANTNLTPTKNIGDMSLTEFFTITNVAPQIKVAKRSADSAKYFFMNAELIN
jgi:hypothetical protein